MFGEFVAGWGGFGLCLFLWIYVRLGICWCECVVCGLFRGLVLLFLFFVFGRCVGGVVGAGRFVVLGLFFWYLDLVVFLVDLYLVCLLGGFFFLGFLGAVCFVGGFRCCCFLFVGVGLVLGFGGSVCWLFLVLVALGGV